MSLRALLADPLSRLRLGLAAGVVVTLIASVVAAPASHVAHHADDHVHLPGGAVVYTGRALPHAHVGVGSEGLALAGAAVIAAGLVALRRARR